MKKSAFRKAQNAAAEPDESASIVSDDPLVLTYVDKAILARAMRFLINIQTPKYATRARREGYTPEENDLGWQLWTTAAGRNRPLNHFFTGNAECRLDRKQETRLQLLDDFENTWFPRIRMLIRRVISPAARDAFEAAFFQNLEQQPLGPSVAGSVSGLLSRLRGLATSTHPEAAELLAMVTARGLTEEKLGEMSQILEELQTAEEPLSIPEEVVTAREKQKTAMDKLHGWFMDWATMLRPAFTHRDRVNLGLTIQRKTAAGIEEMLDDDRAVSPPAAPGPTGSAP